MAKRLPRQVEDARPDDDGPDPQSIRLEDKTLEELTPKDLASNSKLQAVVETKLSQQYLNERITKLQSKLDEVESHNRSLCDVQRADGERYRDLSMEIAQLRQARTYARVLVRDGTVSLALGGIIAGTASLVNSQAWRLTATGLGWGVIIMAIWMYKMTQRNIWPAPPPPDDQQSHREETA